MLRRHWLRAASHEHASVAAFDELRSHLRELNAPPSLLARLERAERDERDHTARCLELAHRYGHERFEPGALPAPTTERPSLEELARRQLRDGCLGEGFAAEVLAASARRAAPEVARSLEVMARDEAEHAAGAWAILEFLIERGGASVRRAIAAEVGRLPRWAPFTREPWMYAFDLRREGICSRGEERARHRALRQRVVDRATRSSSAPTRSRVSGSPSAP